MEFEYDNSYQATIGMAPFEALYGRSCRSPVYWEVGKRKLSRPELIQTTREAIRRLEHVCEQHRMDRKVTPMSSVETWSLR